MGKQEVDKDFILKLNENTNKVIPISQHYADNQQDKATFWSVQNNWDGCSLKYM